MRLLPIALLFALPVHAGPIDDARLLYLEGEHEAALDILRPAAEAGDVNAQNILGDAYDTGSGVEIDHAAAADWWERAAAQGFDKAQFNLGLLFERGRDGIEPDLARAAELYEDAMEGGNPTAATNLGFLYESGAVGAERRLDGRPGEPNLARSAELYGIGVERGDAQAMVNLGTFHVRGDGVEEDMTRAMALFRDAGEMGHSAGLSNLGAMYEAGYGAAADPLAAFALYALAARGGHAQAAVNMAWMLSDGTAPGGTPDDPALPLGYCWWGMGLDIATAAGEAGSRFAEDCGILSEGLSDEEVTRAGEIADALLASS